MKLATERHLVASPLGSVMASKVLDNRTLKRLQPATALWKQYDPAAAPRAHCF